jgi:3-phosphoshikimate 1-carboxyvinyltransferase
MACAIAALRANDKVEIEHADAINKSYPDFFNDLKQMNVKVTY